MADQSQTEILLGLSDEENEDLEKLLKAFHGEKQASLTGDSEEIQQQFQTLTKNITQLGKIVLQFDKKLKSLHKISLLSQKKSDVLNERIESIIDAIQDK